MFCLKLNYFLVRIIFLGNGGRALTRPIYELPFIESFEQGSRKKPTQTVAY